MKHLSTVLTVLALFIAPKVFSEEKAFDLFYETAREKCHDIASIRREMDRINHDILRLVAERTAYVKRAGDLKSLATKVADDRQRVADQEKKIITASMELGLSTEISIPVFRELMENSIRFQQKYIDQLAP